MTMKEKSKAKSSFNRGMTTGVVLGSLAMGAGMLLKDNDLRTKVKETSVKTWRKVGQNLSKSKANTVGFDNEDRQDDEEAPESQNAEDGE